MDKLKSWKVTHINKAFRRQHKKKKKEKRKYLYLIVKKKYHSHFYILFDYSLRNL